ncbi:unnamed protein product [Cuscuta campestris]|uniref:Uncharacterized protein n=1 Tax=Cuscuta campestris TaxID=132261 RepID=A0A484KCC9_9ASTE|nr:unnamed protein product [Cuscuta campestris]
MTTRSSTTKKMANRERVDDDDDFVDKIPIIKTINLVKTTSGRVYKRLCDEEVLVRKAELKESVQWTEMAATTAEKGKEKIAMLFSKGDASKAKFNDGGGEHIDEGYGAGRRKLKGKLHWGNVDSTNEEEINGQPKEKGKVVIRKKTKGQKTDKKSDGSRGGASRGAPQGRQSGLGEGRENEPSLRDIMMAIVVMEKRNMKMRTEVTKLQIALNAQSRVLNRFISMNRMGKRWRKGKKRTTEDNAMPSFDLGFVLGVS